MQAADELLTISELAIGIAGFSGIIAVFLQQGGLHPFDRFRFVNLFVTAFSALVLAFIPFLASSFIPAGEMLWQFSSGAMIVMWCINVGFTVRYVVPLIRKHMPAGASPLPDAFAWSLSALNLVVQSINSSGLVWTPCPEAFVLGLLIYLVVAGFLFTYIILYRPDESI